MVGYDDPRDRNGTKRAKKQNVWASDVDLYVLYERLCQGAAGLRALAPQVLNDPAGFKRLPK